MLNRDRLIRTLNDLCYCLKLTWECLSDRLFKIQHRVFLIIVVRLGLVGDFQALVHSAHTPSHNYLVLPPSKALMLNKQRLFPQWSHG